METELYHHRQTGKMILAMAAVFAIVFAFMIYADPTVPSWVLALVIGIELVLLWLFGSLNVTVWEGAVRVAFGPGLIRRTIAADRIRSVQVARNSWIWGWGVRIYPGGVMFNIAGLDAVELELEGGRRFRIGTDEPIRLQAVIQQLLSTVASRR